MGGAITLTGNTNTELEMTYAAAKKRAEPYTKIVEELPTMRREAVQLVRQAVGAGRRAYVLVNNRAEGTAPLTVEGLGGDVAGLGSQR
jgi:hypothetical protein